MNPYQPSPKASGSDAQQSCKGKLSPVVKAATVGVAYACIGPAFLAAYYAYHRIEFPLDAMLYLFAARYFAPALLGIAVAILCAPIFDYYFPSLSRSGSRALPVHINIFTFALLIVLLLEDWLNFAVDLYVTQLPAFAVGCACATMQATFLHRLLD